MKKVYGYNEVKKEMVKQLRNCFDEPELAKEMQGGDADWLIDENIETVNEAINDSKMTFKSAINYALEISL